MYEGDLQMVEFPGYATVADARKKLSDELQIPANVLRIGSGDRDLSDADVLASGRRYKVILMNTHRRNVVKLVADGLRCVFERELWINQTRPYTTDQLPRDIVFVSPGQFRVRSATGEIGPGSDLRSMKESVLTVHYAARRARFEYVIDSTKFGETSLAVSGSLRIVEVKSWLLNASRQKRTLPSVLKLMFWDTELNDSVALLSNQIPDGATMNVTVRLKQTVTVTHQSDAVYHFGAQNVFDDLSSFIPSELGRSAKDILIEQGEVPLKACDPISSGGRLR
jgi:hypothetical protein